MYGKGRRMANLHTDLHHPLPVFALPPLFPRLPRLMHVGGDGYVGARFMSQMHVHIVSVWKEGI